MFEQIDTRSKSATASVDEAKERFDQYIRETEERVRKSAARVSVTAAQNEFAAAGQSHARKAVIWGIVSVAVIGSFIWFAWHLVAGPTPSFAVGETGGESKESTALAVYYTAIRITVLTAMGAVATFCLRILRAQLHMYELNLHRKRLYNSMAAFVESASTLEQRDIILGRLVDAVATFGISGLLSEKDDSVGPMKLAIDSVNRQVKE